jgi:UDP-N-acetylglucosamine 1-carboxyvinyltransferase
MFDSRLGYVSELRRMGARIDISGSGRMAMVHGPTPLRGAEVCALDIRSGAAVILAGLAAEGETRIKNVVYIDRGYENIEDKLRALGATITRLEDVTPPCPVATCSEPIEWEMAPVQWR